MKTPKTNIINVFSFLAILFFVNYNANAQSLKVTIDKNKIFQTIDRFGVSDACVVNFLVKIGKRKKEKK